MANQLFWDDGTVILWDDGSDILWDSDVILSGKVILAFYQIILFLFIGIIL